ncbi:MAG: 8-oxo-dGTP diphosphatase [Candidatus Komeilibacteria bacterium]
MECKLLTLCMLREGDKLLLGMKKRGFGEGWYNGFGGKLEEGESLEEAAFREMKEESGVKAKNLRKTGVLKFDFVDNRERLEVHVFHVTEYEGEPIESEEMKPEWFHVDEIPFNKMWPDDIHWLPLFLEGHLFEGVFSFDKDHKMLSHNVKKVDSLN